MTENKRSRQFKLWRRNPTDSWLVCRGEYNVFQLGIAESIHVIEFSEVERLEWKDKMLGEQLAGAESTIQELESENAELKTKIENMEQKLKMRDARTIVSNEKWEKIEREFYLKNDELLNKIAELQSKLTASNGQKQIIEQMADSAINALESKVVNYELELAIPDCRIAELESKLELMNKNSISLFLHEQRMAQIGLRNLELEQENELLKNQRKIGRE